jgi:hypothetical protein
MIGCMRHYVHDDAGYLAWISGHPDGFVINTYSRPGTHTAYEDPTSSFEMRKLKEFWRSDSLPGRREILHAIAGKTQEA